MQVQRLAASIALTLALGFGAVDVQAVGAQEPDSAQASAPISHILRTRDGSLFVGRLLADDGESVRFLTIGGIVVVRRTDVVELRAVAARAVRQGQYWAPDPNDTRLFFAPTGRMLAKGDGYFSDTYLLFLNFVGGVSSNFTMGGGFSIIPSDNPQNNIVYITPKVRLLQSERVNIAVGALAAFAGFEDFSDDDWERNLGILYGVGTFGGPEASMTFGAGWGYTGNGIADQPVLMIGGASRAGRRFTLVTENYIFPSSGDMNGLVSYGVRLLGEKLSVDLAFFNLVGTGSTFLFPGIPYINVAMKF